MRSPCSPMRMAFSILTDGEMIRGAADVRRYDRVDVAERAVGVARARQLPRFVDARFSALDVAAAEVHEAEPHERARGKRALPDGASDRNRALGDDTA